MQARGTGGWRGGFVGARSGAKKLESFHCFRRVGHGFADVVFVVLRPVAEGTARGVAHGFHFVDGLLALRRARIGSGLCSTAIVAQNNVERGVRISLLAIVDLRELVIVDNFVAGIVPREVLHHLEADEKVRLFRVPRLRDIDVHTVDLVSVSEILSRTGGIESSFEHCAASSRARAANFVAIRGKQRRGELVVACRISGLAEGSRPQGRDGAEEKNSAHDEEWVVVRRRRSSWGTV